MEAKLTPENRKCIEDGIRRKYTKVAVTPEGLFRYPTGRVALEGLAYDPSILRTLPESAIQSYCGVGNPFSLGVIHEGEAVLDIGCGGGFDTLVAAIMVGPTGRAVGIDMVAEMVGQARQRLHEAGLANVAYQQASGEQLPFPNESFDVVISNGVFNLIPNKSQASREAFRVTKPGGRLMIADNVLTGERPKEAEAIVESWAR